VRIFRRDDMRARLLKEFKDIKVEPYPFLETFKLMKNLWIDKLCTSLEEFNRNQEQLSISKKRVSELEEQLQKKTNDKDTFTNLAKEQKDQRTKEISELKETQANLRQDKVKKEEELLSKGDNDLKNLREAHEERKNQLRAEIDRLEQELKATKKLNGDEESALVGKYEIAEKGYKDTLETYDQDMRENIKQKDNAQKAYDEEFAHLKSVREQWEERQEENRKREALQKIIDERKRVQQKKLDTLNKAAQFLQAHWRGMMQRKEQEKARKGKKGRKRGKK
jgi:DNA repair exonuclease SbcCD ATPase subunit